MKAARRRVQRIRRWLNAAVAGLLVGAATLIALGRLLVPWLVDSPEAVATWLGERIGRSVELDAVSAYWEGSGPVLDLSGLRISAASGEAAAIRLGRARVHTDVYAWFLPGRHPIRDFLLVDARVDLVREVDGRMTLEGFGRSVPGGQGLTSWLGRVGHLGLSGGKLGLRDRASGRSFELDAVELRLRQQGDTLTVGLERHAADDAGRLRVLLELTGEEPVAPGAARLYLEAEHFPLDEFAALGTAFGIGVRTGVLDGRQWLDWKDGRLAGLQGDWRVVDLVLSAPAFGWSDGGRIAPNLHLRMGRMQLLGAAERDTFVIDGRAGDGSRDGAFSLRLAAGLDLAAEAIPVELLAGAALLIEDLPEAARARLYAAQPRGLVERLHATKAGGEWQLHARLAGLEARPAGPHWPEIVGLDAEISADRQAGTLRVDGDALEFAIPGVFRAPIPIHRLDLLAGWHVGERGWVIEAPMLSVGGAEWASEVALRLDLDPQTGPQLTASAHVPGARIEAAKAFWPVNTMPPRTLDWLDRALGEGGVDWGRVLFRGALRDWPFAAAEGRFEARFAVSGAGLDYHPDWPSASALAAEVSFVNSMMQVHDARGILVGNRVVRARGGIASLKDPVLELDLGGVGDAGNWLQFLKASPLQRSHAQVLFGMAMRGLARVDARLTIPLRKDLGDTRVDGEALLDGVEFSDAKWKLDLTELRGRVDFTQSGFAADHLSLALQGCPAELAIAVGSFSPDPDLLVTVGAHGRLPASALFGHHANLATILAQTHGAADWDIDVEVRRGIDAQAPARTRLRYASDLNGIGIAFPAPVGKSAEVARPLDLEVQISADESIAPALRLRLGSQARLLAELGDRGRDFRGQLQFGPETERDLPARGLRVGGSAAELDIAGWAGWVLATATGDPAHALLADIDLTVGGDRLRLDRSEGPWVLRVDGPAAIGQVRFEAGDTQRPSAVVAQFEKLHLPEPGSGVGELSISPALVPTLHLWARDLRIGGAGLGEARLEAFPSAGGLRIDLLEARSPHLEIHASGDWRSTRDGQESRLRIRMLSEDLGRMLSGLGYAGLIAGGQTLAEIDAHWRGAPHAFALERLTGSIDVSIGQGRFLDVDPGAGRIFGLLSLRELPRRLTLDFRDLFQSGMSFDRIEGRFQLADGNAWTENLTVRGPAADILIIGRTGLASRDYDQQVMVSPRVSGMLPMIGVLAGGPVGAAAGFLAQGMVGGGEDIERSSRVHYSVAGSWEKPVVARLSPMRPDAPPRRRTETPGGAG
ncbi:MAG: TIGR02099 family protein [Xanthomonadales bacterium]|nr:hypothetical protein [Xanthomonadales bacterium]MCC6594778.1 TIGR02099 family protein [Xanthomonadales bacterium]MCE7931740.1 TIGR02099 family protein [Xanthomonadales bacterium PRO6]